MKVGDLVRNKTSWGTKDRIGLIVKAHYENLSLGAEKTKIITLDNKWEYHAKDLEVISESR